MNRSQRKLLGVVLPFATVLILYILPIKGWDKRPLYFAIFLAILIVGYCEIVLFELEHRLRLLGRLFVVGFPVAAIVVAFFITASPTIRTVPAYWYPSEPEMQSSPLDDLPLFPRPTWNEQDYQRYKADAREKKAAAYKESLREWEKTRTLIPEKNSLEFKKPIDRWTAPYWLALLLVVGAIEFRLLAQKFSND